MAVGQDRSEAGFSLVEIMVAAVLSLGVLGMAYGILNSTTKTANAVANRAHNSTQATLLIDTLEDNVRYANGVWLCSPLTSTPQTALSATVSCPAYSTGSAALLVSNDTSLASLASGPSCTEWIIGTAGLYEVRLGVAASGTFAVTPLTNIPGVVAAANGTGTSGFSLGIPGTTNTTPAIAISGRLVLADVTVNQDPTGSYVSGDGVTVHDVIAPTNLTTLDDTTNTPCT